MRNTTQGMEMRDRDKRSKTLIQHKVADLYCEQESLPSGRLSKVKTGGGAGHFRVAVTPPTNKAGGWSGR
eukprot:3433462-Lingulodinium_polyedra.AAC.1